MDNFPEWYQQVITKAELIDYHDISGFYILRPWAFAIWEKIREWLDGKWKECGVQNAYFPLLVTENALKTEKDHVEGFAPEVAWVTKAGNRELAQVLAIRPTSETIIYPTISKWIHSHRDLPLLLNQWTSVVRWEFDNPTPFLRSREFLWQEGHTAWETKEQAEREVLERLQNYSDVYEQLLAVPVIKGRKTVNEKFAGADYTTSVETVISATGRGIQAGTSHHLGQNFSKIFDVKYTKGDLTEYAWQNSWGLTTRSIGIMIMTHGDNKGLVLPPRVAPIQVVINLIFIKEAVNPDRKADEALLNFSNDVFQKLKSSGVRVHLDDRKHVTPGYKYNHWEMKGVPLRIDIGPIELASSSLVFVKRNDGTKFKVNASDAVPSTLSALNLIQDELFTKAKTDLLSKIKKISKTDEGSLWDNFVSAIEKSNIALVPFCEEANCEEKVKKSGHGKSLCIPFDQEPLHNEHCFVCKKEAKSWTLFGKTY
uniref:proline--tRNA ligase n=1 Tax=Arcella intermedia TaxID=1963864 RepID=A0A6B2L1P8_9EUKA